MMKLMFNLLEYVGEKGLENITIEGLVQYISEQAKDAVPDRIKAEILSDIKHSIEKK